MELSDEPRRPVIPIVNCCGGAYIDVSLVRSGQDIRRFELSNEEALALLIALAKGLARNER